MKIKLILAFILLFTGLLYVFLNSQKDRSIDDDPHISQEEKTVNHILVTTAKIIEQKYNVRVVGSGAAMPGGRIQCFNLEFESNQKLSRESLRVLLLSFAQELLQQINLNRGIRHALVTYPCTVENIRIAIYNRDVNWNRLRDPEISTAEIAHNFLMYRTIDPADRFRFKNQINETYEDALKAVQHP